MGEDLRLLGGFVLLIALLVACTNLSLFLALNGQPAVGSLATIVAIVLWAKLVPPMPGFVQGIVSVAGMFTLIGVLLACLGLLLRGLVLSP